MNHQMERRAKETERLSAPDADPIAQKSYRFKLLVSTCLSPVRLLGETIRRIGTEPYLIFNTILTFSVSAGVYAVLFTNSANDFIAKIASGDILSMTLALTSASALMIGSLSTAHIARHTVGYERSKNTEATMNSIQKLESLSLNLLKNMDQKLSIFLDELNSEKQPATISIRKPNKPAIWRALSPNSEYRTVNSFAQGDINIYRDADGQKRIQPIVSRIWEWVPRYLIRTKLALVSHVFLLSLDRLADDSAEVPMSMIRVLGAYRVLLKIIHDNGLDAIADFSFVRLHIYSTEAQFAQAFFVGIQKSSDVNAKPTNFVLKYEALNFVLGMNLPNELFDNTVVQCFDPAEIDAHRQTARALASQSERSFTLDEALDRFGHLIPPIDDFDAVMDPETRSILGIPPTNANTVSEVNPYPTVIDFGDGSFRID